MDKHLLERAYRIFIASADLNSETDRRIDDWLKAQISAHEQCASCGASRDSEIHYVGTVDSHVFVRPSGERGAMSHDAE